MGWSNWGGCCAREALRALHLLISWWDFCLQNLIWAAALCRGSWWGGKAALGCQQLEGAKPVDISLQHCWMLLGLLIHSLADGSHPSCPS